MLRTHSSTVALDHEAQVLCEDVAVHAFILTGLRRPLCVLLRTAGLAQKPHLRIYSWVLRLS